MSEMTVPCIRDSSPIVPSIIFPVLIPTPSSYRAVAGVCAVTVEDPQHLHDLEAGAHSVHGAAREERHDAVTEILVDESPVPADDRRNAAEVRVEELEVLHGCHVLRQGRERAYVGKENRQLQLEHVAEDHVLHRFFSQEAEELPGDKAFERAAQALRPFADCSRAEA